MADHEELGELLKRKVVALREIAFRRSVIAAELAKLEIETAGRVLAFFFEQAESGQPNYRDILNALGDFEEYRNRIGEEKSEELYIFCVKENFLNVANALRRIPPKRHIDENPDEVFIDRRLQDVALGVRKSMGRTGKRMLIDRLLHDQNPTVIEQILKNPGLTEDQVVKIASKRPTSSEVLRKIGESVKWMKSYRVKKALVFNPYTPTEIGMRLLRVLMRQDVDLVARNEALHFELRHWAKRMLNRVEDELG